MQELRGIRTDLPHAAANTRTNIVIYYDRNDFSPSFIIILRTYEPPILYKTRKQLDITRVASIQISVVLSYTYSIRT